MHNTRGALPAAILFLALAGVACTSGKKSLDPTAGLPDCGPTAPLTVAPLADADLRGLVPLGNLNPPGHTFPTDHQYFYLVVSGTSGNTNVTNVAIPGDGRITAITASQHLSAMPPFTDWGVTFMPCKQVQLSFGHVATLGSAIAAAVGTIPESACQTYSTGGQTYKNCYEQVKIDVKAGDPLGTAGGNPGQLALDLGAFDNRITPLVYANPALTRSDPQTGFDDFHVVCPVDYFVPAVKSALEARLGSYDGTTHRTVAPICGTSAQDVVGTAQGRWFVPGTTQPNPEDPHLALVHDNVDPTVGAFSAGTTTSALNGVFRFTPATTGNVNLDFNLVTPSSGKVCYDLSGGPSAGSVLVEMTSVTGLTIGRVASPCGAGPWTFTPGAKSFVR